MVWPLTVVNQFNSSHHLKLFCCSVLLWFVPLRALFNQKESQAPDQTDEICSVWRRKKESGATTQVCFFCWDEVAQLQVNLLNMTKY